MNTNSIVKDEIRVILDPILAMQEFVIVPIADGRGVTGEQVEELYDTELIFSELTEYDSINGREGFRLRQDVDMEDFWDIVGLFEK